MKDKLRNLITEEHIDEDLLYEVLSPLIAFDKKEGKILFKSEFGKISEKKKILVYLLAKKAKILLKLDEEGEEAGPSEIGQKTGVNENTVKVTLMRYLASKTIAKREKGYYIPSYNLQIAVEEIRGGTK